VIFVDTSFWFALRMRRDSRHADANAILEQHSSEAFVTTNHVRGETWTLLRRRGGYRNAHAFLNMTVETPRLRVEFVPEELESDAWTWLRRHDERAYSFVDATSFALMHSLGIHEAFAFDGDFAAAGFVELRPS
jgi:uncharacterized protein